MPLLFIDSYKKTYYANAFSLASCITFLFLIFVVLIPIFAGYASEDFWNSLQTYYEQPIVIYNSNYLIYTMEGDIDQGNLEGYFSSSSTDLNSYYPGKLVTNPSISVGQYDDDNDGKNDRLVAKISFSSENSKLFKNVKFLLFLDYGLRDKAKLLMNTMVYVDIDTPNGVSEITTKGDLILKQTSPIASTSIPSKQYYSTDLFEVDLYSPYDFLEIYNKFTNRNYTTSYEYIPFIIPPNSGSNVITMNIEINIPKLQKVFFYQSVYLNLKEAWIQYLFIFIPIFVGVYYLLLFILENQVFPCSVKSDLGR